jgi:hypothetical protein
MNPYYMMRYNYKEAPYSIPDLNPPFIEIAIESTINMYEHTVNF